MSRLSRARGITLAWTRVGREKPASARARSIRGSRICEKELNVAFLSTRWTSAIVTVYFESFNWFNTWRGSNLAPMPLANLWRQCCQAKAAAYFIIKGRHVLQCILSTPLSKTPPSYNNCFFKFKTHSSSKNQTENKLTCKIYSSLMYLCSCKI